MKADNYVLNLFKECPSKYEKRVVKELVPSSPNLPASFGIAIHEGLAVLYNNGGIEDAISAFKKEWNPFEGLDSKGLYTLERGALILINYSKMFMDPMDIVPIENGIEVGIAVELPASSNILTGRIDLVGSFKNAPNELMVVDHKSRGKSLSTYCVNPNFQLLGYSYGVKETLGLQEYPPVVANLIKVVKKHDPSDFVLRSVLYPTAEMLSKYFDSTIYWMAKIQECHNFNLFPMRGDDFTCAWCKYKPLCEAPHLEDQFVEEGVFKKEVWEAY